MASVLDRRRPGNGSLVIGALTARDDRLCALTYPRFRFAVEAGGQGAALVHPAYAGCVAWEGDRPVGLALLGRSAESTWRLASVAVARENRRQGIAGRLLGAAEELARAAGAEALRAVHSSRMPARPAFERLLARAGWSAPALLEMRFTGRADWYESAGQEWVALLRRLERGGFGVTPWDERDDADRAAVAALAAQAPPDQQPDEQPDKGGLADPAVSVLIRRHGVPVGWVLGQAALDPGHYRYTVGYVIPPLQRSGWLIGAMMAVCRMQAAVAGAGSIASFETTVANAGMQALMTRRLAPRAERLALDCRYLAEKRLRPPVRLFP